MPAPIVTHMSCIFIGGPDARDFAQAQFASDVSRLGPMQWQWSTWLDARGRVLALMHLAAGGDGTLLAVLRGGAAADICERLARFRLRARVTFRVCAFAGYALPAAPCGRVAIDGGNYRLGFGDRSLGLSQSTGPVEALAATAWRRADIRTGWPSLPVTTSPLLPPALSLERLGAVSLEKGCYPGQEIVARLHHLGSPKRRLCHLRGRVAAPIGSCSGSPGTAPVDVLDAAFSNGSADVLAIIRTPVPMQINILENNYNVISIFDA